MVRDMPLVAPPDEVYSAFMALELPDPLTEIVEFQTNQTINETLKEFIAEWMTDVGSDLENVTGLVPVEAPEWFQVRRIHKKYGNVDAFALAIHKHAP